MVVPPAAVLTTVLLRRRVVSNLRFLTTDVVPPAAVLTTVLLRRRVVSNLRFLTTEVGHRGGGAATLEAQLNVAAQVVLTGGSSLASRTKGGDSRVVPHQLHLAEGTERRHDSPTQVLQNGTASGDERRQVGITSTSKARRVRAVHTPVGRGQSQGTIGGVQEVHPTVKGTHVDVEADVVHVRLGSTIEHRGHLYIPELEKNLALPVYSSGFHIPW